MKAPLKRQRNLSAMHFWLVLWGNPSPIETTAIFEHCLTEKTGYLLSSGPGQDPQLNTNIFISGTDTKRVTNLLPLVVLECFIPCIIHRCWVLGKWDRHRTESPSRDQNTRLCLLSTVWLVPKTGVVGNELIRSTVGAKEGVSVGSWTPSRALHFPNLFGQFSSISLASALPAVWWSWVLLSIQHSEIFPWKAVYNCEVLLLHTFWKVPWDVLEW